MALFTALALGAASALASRQRAKQEKKLLRARQAAFQRAQSLLTPEALSGRVRSLTDLFRQDIASQDEPQLRQNVARSLGQSGLAETGVGGILANAALVAPRLSAFREALGAGERMGTQAAGLAAQEAETRLPTTPGLFESLLQGVGTGSTFASLFGSGNQDTTTLRSRISRAGLV